MEAKPYKIPHPYRKLKKELIDKIVQDFREGSTKRFACCSNGITERIWDVWIQQGKIDIEHGLDDTLCAYLVLTLSKVHQAEIKKCRKMILSRKFSHKGAEWTLEHAYWRDFSSKASDVDFEERLSNLEDKQNPLLYNGAPTDGQANSEKAEQDTKK